MVIKKLALNKMIGIIPNTGDSVKEIREIRKKLSKEKFDNIAEPIRKVVKETGITKKDLKNTIKVVRQNA